MIELIVCLILGIIAWVFIIKKGGPIAITMLILAVVMNLIGLTGIGAICTLLMWISAIIHNKKRRLAA